MYRNPILIAVFAIAIIQLIPIILNIADQYPHETSKAAAYADDLTAAATVKGISIGGNSCARKSLSFDISHRQLSHG